MKKENEIWKVIPNYENYEASNFGRIRSIDRVVKRDRYTTRKIKGKILQQFAKNSGYLQVNLSKNSKIETKTVHRLVAIQKTQIIIQMLTIKMKINIIIILIILNGVLESII